MPLKEIAELVGRHGPNIYRCQATCKVRTESGADAMLSRFLFVNEHEMVESIASVVKVVEDTIKRDLLLEAWRLKAWPVGMYEITWWHAHTDVEHGEGWLQHTW